MPSYAANTDVSVERSRAEIERTLARYGATSFAYGWNDTGAAVEFTMNNRRIRFTVALPNRNDREFTHTPTRGTERTRKAAEEAWEQACRQKWRALNLVIKAKLEAVDAGISEFEDEFLAAIVLPDGGTVGTWMRPQVEAAYISGEMPALMPALASGR